MPAPNVEEVQVPCSLFLGLNTEVAPPDLPEGVSPACQDVRFVPGSVSSREALQKLFAAAFPGNPTVTYQKTFLQPDGDPLNFYLTSDGTLRFEDVLNSPGAYTTLAQVIAGLYAESCTASGAEYFAFSDGLRGLDVPRQAYRTQDGALHFDRISQDGPGANSLAIVDYQGSAGVVSTGGGFASANIAASPTGATQSGNIVTIITNTAHGFIPGEIVFVSNVGVAGYNGLQTVGTVPSTTSFTYTITATGLAGSGGGQCGPPISEIITNITSTTHPNINVGDTIALLGTGGGLDNNVAGNPATWQVVEVGYAFGHWFINFSFATAPSTVTITLTGAGGTVSFGGQSSPGVHQCVFMFLTRSGFLTEPSPPISFVSAGNSQWQITNIPLGPPNVIARIFAFTGAGGDNFFTITTPIQFPNPFGLAGSDVLSIFIEATAIYDNTSTSTIIDTSDNALFGAQAIDIDGNDLFNQVVLGPCLGTFYYASRFVTWGMSNKLENFLNMGFEGGYLSGVLTTPLGWTVANPGGLLVNGSAGYGQSWQITGDGSGSRKGEITQGCYQNAYGINIVEASTQYTMRFYATASAGATGTLFFDIYSPSVGLLARASINIAQIVTDGAGFYEELFGAVLPTVIPADAILDIYEIGMAAAHTVTLDELEVIPTYDPFFESFLISYVDNFEAFDAVSGVMGPTADPNPLRGCETLRDNLQFLTTGGMHQTSDNGEEPSSWTVTEISNDVGLAAYRALDAGEECIIFVSKSGGGDGTNPTYALRIFEGGQPWKISQEVQSIFDDINPAAEQTMWLVNDIGQRRIYIGVPEGDATAPSQLYVLDYREIDTAVQLAQAPSIHISFTGKMIASDLARKWNPWNVQANCGAMLARPGNSTQFCLGGGNGSTPGAEAGFGNSYFLNPLKYTDDDYGVISPFYVMYFFISRDNETALGVGSMRKLYKRVSEFISGIGNLTVTPYAASLTNSWPSPPTVQLSQTPIEDIYHGLNVSTERMAVKYAVTPLPATTDVQFTLQHMEATVMQHPMSPFGTGANL